MKLVPMKFPDGSCAVQGEHNLIAAVFADGPFVVHDDSAGGVPCSWDEAAYVVNAFGGVRRLEEAFERCVNS